MNKKIPGFVILYAENFAGQSLIYVENMCRRGSVIL